MDLVVTPAGIVRAIYSEPLDLGMFGPAVIRRTGHVEPDPQGRWWADLRPVAGPVLGPFAVRSLALDAEVTWLTEHWLARIDSGPGFSSRRTKPSDLARSRGRESDLWGRAQLVTQK
jgi:hypothetical protein